MTTCVKLLNPIEDKKEQTLLKVASIADKRGTPILLCGAMARDILFWHMHSIALIRGTMDLDISIQTSDWTAYEEFRKNVLSEGFENLDADHPEKLRDTETGSELDLLPFGEIANDGKMIVWPEDNSLWSVIGYEEALENALHAFNEKLHESNAHATPEHRLRIRSQLTENIMNRCHRFFITHHA